MQLADDTRFAQAITALFETLGYKTTENLLRGFRMALDDLSIEEVEAACMRGMRALTFQPKPADLRALAGKRDITIEDRAVAAWDSLIATIRATSGYADVDFEDKIINATIREMGGWERISGLTKEELHKWTVKDFTRIYCAFARNPTALSDEALRPLLGLYSGYCEPEFRHLLAPPRVIPSTVPLLPLPHRPAPDPRIAAPRDQLSAALAKIGLTDA